MALAHKELHERLYGATAAGYEFKEGGKTYTWENDNWKEKEEPIGRGATAPPGLCANTTTGPQWPVVPGHVCPWCSRPY